MPGPIYYLSLGSNMGDREGYLCDAIGRLQAIGRIAALSSFYETEPVEVSDQDWFVNCVVALETSYEPQQLMALILKIEQAMGRQRIKRKGPRTIDIDILLVIPADNENMSDENMIDTPGLTIPHPAMHERRFVLEPLAQIAPDVRHPRLKQTIRELLQALPRGQIVRRVKKESKS